MPFNQQMSIPVELTLTGGSQQLRLSRLPVNELTSLHRKTTTISEGVAAKGNSFKIQSDATFFDLSFDLIRSEANTLYIVIRGQALTVNWLTNEVKFEGARANKVVPERNPMPLPNKESNSLRILVDKTSLELFVGDGEISASFCYLPDAYSDPIVFNCYEGQQLIKNIELHEMKSIWADEKEAP